MRYLFAGLALAGALCGCAKRSSSGDGVNPTSTFELDRLWSLAPAGARGGIVVSPRAMGMLEDGLATFRAAIAKAPELAVVGEEIDGALTRFAGKPDAKLADMGMARTKGAAIFAGKDGEMLAILPVVDRDKFLAQVKGQKGATPADPDRIENVTCRTVQNVYACGLPATLLDTLGKGALKPQLAKLGTARGDVELVGVDLAFGGEKPSTLASVLQLTRGGGTLRGVISDAPGAIRERFGAPTKQAPRANQSVAFALLEVRPFFTDLPLEQAFGPDIAAMLQSIAGPITATVPAGESNFDAKLPLTDIAAAQKLVDSCTSLPGVGPSAKLENGVCHFPVPSANLEIDLWIDAPGKALRLGKKQMKPGPMLPPSNVGRELAGGDWSFAFWGRGTVMGPTVMPGLTAGSVDPQTALILRALAMVNEMGMGVRVDDKAAKLTFVATVRTIFANPDPVVAKLLEVTPDDIAAARAGDKAKPIAMAASTAPFAKDYQAGQMGLGVPYMMLGMVAAVAIPAVVEYMRTSRQPEAVQQLTRIASSARAQLISTGSYPKLDVPLTPASSCCGPPTNTCVTGPNDWAAWQPLQFSVEGSQRFQYSYKASEDGKSFVATAVGDLDCDGTMITYEARGTDDGAVQLVEPQPDAD